MSTNKIYIGLLLLLALAQLYAAGGMIIHHDKVLSDGQEHRFLIEPIDPSDPFRGKYLILGFEADDVMVSEPSDYEDMMDVYGILKRDKNGYTYISSIQDEMPQEEFLKLSIDYVASRNDTLSRVILKFPFDRFYLSETKALPAEEILQKALNDGENVKPYAVVKILEGDAVLEDLVLNGRSINQILREIEP